MGAGHIVVIGAPEEPRLAVCREFGADATVSIETHRTPQARIEAVREVVGGYGADVVVDCAGHPSAGPEGIEMLRDGGTYVEMGQFTDAGAVETNWHRFCVKDITLLGSWAFTANDIPRGIAMLDRTRNRYPWHLLQTKFPFSEEGIVEATQCAMTMRCVKATIVPNEDID
jgi:threonine dehydrogenase-like Zn-dependent dehydrogenase